MKKLLKKKALRTKQDKLTEKAFIQSITISVIGMILCIVVMCSATWAWFDHSVSSGSNTISTGHFDLSLKIDDSMKIIGNSIEKDNDGIMRCELVKGEYIITLKTTDNTTVSKGYCLVTVTTNDGNSKKYKKYKTAAIEKNSDFTFTIEIQTEKNVDISFAPVWGSPAEDESVIQNGGTLIVESTS